LPRKLCSSRIVRRLILIIGLVLGAGFAAPAAEATIGSCLPPAAPAMCEVWKGKVTYISDGDTVWVDLDGDRTRQTFRVRLTGVNTMEQTVYSRLASQRRGECHAVEATARLERLLRRSRMRVRLAALDPASRSGIRLRRSMAVRINGRWRDVGRLLMAEGHALWLPSSREYAWNADYARQGEYAAAQQRGIWNPTYCGAGPSDASPLRVTVNGDSRFLSDEWVRIRNLDPVNPVSLGGWWLRDSSLSRFVFPDWATLPPGETLTVYTGEGTNTWTEFYWGRSSGAFDNLGADGTGDGAYLFDPHGDMRAWMTYPCARDCNDPYLGAVKVSAKPKGREHVTVTNVAAFAVDLDGYRLQSPPYTYAFPLGSVLQPGEQMQVNVLGDPAEDTQLEKHWGETGSILNNGGDKVRVTSLRGVVLDCFTWGTGVC
jgi:endonuclease YncB( thermonuclease family)